MRSYYEGNNVIEILKSIFESPGRCVLHWGIPRESLSLISCEDTNTYIDRVRSLGQRMEDKWTQLKHLDFSMLKLRNFYFNNLDGIAALESLSFNSCEDLESFGTEGLEHLGHLTRLEMIDCKKLSRNGLMGLIGDVRFGRSLTVIDMRGCQRLDNVEEYILSPALTMLNLSNCPITQLPSFKDLANLRELFLSGCTKLQELPQDIKDVPLKYLDISGCVSLSA